jgi:hypothetical protein
VRWNPGGELSLGVTYDATTAQRLSTMAAQPLLTSTAPVPASAVKTGARELLPWVAGIAVLGVAALFLLRR